MTRANRFPTVEHTVVKGIGTREDRAVIQKLLADWLEGKEIDGIPLAEVFHGVAKPVVLIVHGWETGGGSLTKAEQVGQSVGYWDVEKGNRYPDQMADKKPASKSRKKVDATESAGS